MGQRRSPSQEAPYVAEKPLSIGVEQTSDFCGVAVNHAACRLDESEVWLLIANRGTVQAGPLFALTRRIKFF